MSCLASFVNFLKVYHIDGSRGRKGRPHLGQHFFSFIDFSEKKSNYRLDPALGVGASPLGNPGSTTVNILSCLRKENGHNSKIVLLNHSYELFKGKLQGKEAMLSRHMYIVGQFCNALKLGKYSIFFFLIRTFIYISRLCIGGHFYSNYFS